MKLCYANCMFDLTPKELATLRPLTTPRKIQDFLDTLKSYEGHKDTCDSPRVVLKKWANCLEAAMLGALSLRLRGLAPLLLDLSVAAHDFDHVIAPFKTKNRWGALSKSKHPVLRYRDPIYKSIRELVMSYFHEYTDSHGRKTLRAYSNPVNLKIFDKQNWATSEQPIWFIEKYLYQVRHFPIVTKKQIPALRPIDPIEKKMGRLKVWP